MKREIKKRTYFMDLYLTTGEFVTVVYESAKRKNTWGHFLDMYYEAIHNEALKDVDWTNGWNKNTTDCAYILNNKNKEDQCFGDYKIIDLRS